MALQRIVQNVASGTSALTISVTWLTCFTSLGVISVIGKMVIISAQPLL